MDTTPEETETGEPVPPANPPEEDETGRPEPQPAEVEEDKDTEE